MATDPIKAMLEGMVLASLSAEPAYGYVIAKRLEDSGVGEVKGGTLYPILGRLTEAGFLQSEWREGTSGPARRYYEVTVAGAARLRQIRDQWAIQRSIIDDSLKESGVA